MKKTLSIVLIITMLLSMFIFTVPASADGGPVVQAYTAPTFDGTGKGVLNAATGAAALTVPDYSNWGNTVVSPTDDTYRDNLIKAGYIPIADTAGIDTGITPDGASETVKTIAFSAASLATGKNYCLWDNITTHTQNDCNNATITIDGCGHSVKMNGTSIFGNANDGTYTFTNITFTGDLKRGDGNGNQPPSVFAIWGSSSVLHFSNITTNVNVYTSNGDQWKAVGKLTNFCKSGSTFTNIYCGGNVNFEETSGRTLQIEAIGGIVGNASGATFTKCVTTGTITIGDGTNAIELSVTEGGIGGLVGVAKSGSSFTNCVNASAILIKNKATLTETNDNDAIAIGGLIGRVENINDTINADINSDANTYGIENCYNAGSITLEAGSKLNKRKDEEGGIGGIVGSVGGTLGIKGCLNAGNLNLSGDFTQSVGGIAGFGRYAGNKCTAISIVDCINNGEINIDHTVSSYATWHGAGGIYGFHYATNSGIVRIYNCTNNKDIKDVSTSTDASKEAKLFRGGIAGGIRGAHSVTVYNCINNGNIPKPVGTNDQTWIAGILALYGSVGNWMGNKDIECFLNIERCTNNGDVTGAGKDVGAMLANTTEVKDEDNKGETRSITFKDCLNTGAISKTSGDVGGFVSWIDGACKLEVKFINCENSGNVSGAANVSGFLGNFGESAGTRTLAFTNCVNKGDVTTTSGYAGGFLNRIDSKDADTTFNNCYNVGDVSYKGGGKNGGGIVARVDRGASFEECHNYGTIEYVSGDAYFDTSEGGIKMGSLGGIVGSIQDGNCSFKKCSNNGKLYSNGATKACYGGIVGASVNAWGVDTLTFENCVNNGEIDLTIGNDNDNQGVGGILGTAGWWKYGCDVTFKECDNNAPISVKASSSMNSVYNVAGILGSYAWGSVKITDSENNGEVYTKAAGKELNGIAGIVGKAGYESKECTLYIKDTKNTAKIYTDNDATRFNVAGIVAMLRRCDAEIIDCVNEGDIQDNCKSREHSQGAGGIVGYAYSNGEPTSTIYIKDCSNYGDVTQRTSAGTVGMGGIIGWARFILDTDIIDCVNEGDVTNKGGTGTGGMLGRIGSVTIGWEGKNLKTSDLDITGCTNRGTISAKTYAAGMIGDYNEVGNGAANLEECKFTVNIKTCVNEGLIQATGGKGAGGIIANAFIDGGTAVTNILDCINKGNVTATGDSVGGIVALINVWGDAKADITMNIQRTVNQGDLSANNGYVGGIMGLLRTDNANKIAHLVINECANYGIAFGGGDSVGGILGDTEKLRPTGTIDITSCVNGGKVDGGSKASGASVGGIVGKVRTYEGKVKIDSCINYGPVHGKAWNCFGIFGQNQGRTGEGSVAVENCVNYGRLNSSVAGSSKEQPIGYADKLTNNYFYTGCLDEGATSTNGQGLSNFDNLLAVTKEINNIAGSFAYLQEAIDACDTYFDNEEDYVPVNIQTLRQAVQGAETLKTNGFYSVNAEGTLVFAEQTVIEAQKDVIKKAIRNTYRKSEIAQYFATTLEDADELVADNTDIYKAEPWETFMAAYVAAKNLAAQGDINGMDNDTLFNTAETLRLAYEALSDNDTLGGDIYTAADFALLAGQKGTFVLKNDITVSAPVEGFRGVLIGNGKTITLDGCALFTSLNGVEIYNLTVEGDAGEAKSVFGEAKGDVKFYNIFVKVEGELENAIVSGTSKLDLQSVLVMSKATAIAKANTLTAKSCYLDGVVYYNAEGTESKDAKVFASGEVAYVMNSSVTLGDMLVQRIGKDALPRIAAPLMDGSNIVYLVGEEYVNGGFVITPPTIAPIDPETNVPVSYAELTKTIVSAELLVEADYTAESWKALADALAAANTALTAETQKEVDDAANALILAMASLDKKPAETVTLDLSKLNAAIEKAEKLVLADYTTASWTVVQTSLSLAKAAKIADNQADIDAAVASLEAAMAALTKVPAQTDKPADKPQATEPAPKKDGCGSIIGGAAVAVVAVMALGMGITFKKKED